MGLAISDSELQSIYEVVQAITYKDEARITSSSDTLKYTNAPCVVRSPVTSVEYDQDTSSFVYEGSYTLAFPKWVDIDTLDKVYVLGVQLSVRSVEYPKTDQLSKVITATFVATDDTYTTDIVAPYDVIWTSHSNNPITTESGESLII
jgi:hypothetical protein